MERLIEIVNGIPTYNGKECHYDIGLTAGEMTSSAVREVMTRLAAYEDAIPFAELPRAAELVKADDEGLCMVLNEPRKPLILDDDHEAVRCPYCGIDLMGIPYGDRMLLQCPECGEYVDGTKVITRAEAEAALDDK